MYFSDELSSNSYFSAWAICTICLGVVTNFGGLLAVRIFLGIAEGGLFPGVTYYITLWYRRHECGLRMALFFSAATAAGAFGGLLAFGINKMGKLPTFFFLTQQLTSVERSCWRPSLLVLDLYS